MNQLIEPAVGIVILLVAIGLVEHHRETWLARLDAAKDTNTAEHLFHRGQFRRRVAASSLIALVGALLVADYFVENPLASLSLIAAILLLLPVIFMLAVWDMLSIHKHFHVDREGAAQARRALMDEAERLLAEKQLRDREQSSEQDQQMESHDG